MLQPAACGRSCRNADGAQRRGCSSLFRLRHYFVIRHSSFVIFRIMTSAQIRQSFLDFFREKKHTIVPSSSLLPDAPKLLFTNAGMNQFVPIFLGQQKPPWNPPRVGDKQKCIRTGGKHNDLEDVGVDTYHHTFFEMLGNWSFGDYFKKEAVEWAWELIVDRWKFPAQRLYATVYKPGPDEPSEFDQEAHDHWARLFQDADLDPKIHVRSDTYHHTFFEMLGNWSFGDYFKKEAVEWAWELIVDRWKFPAQRLYATVYKPGPDEPSEFDQEAHDHWARLFQDAGLDPKIHVVSSGKADN